MTEWTLMGGINRGELVYEHRDGTRAYVHVDDQGDIDVAAWDAVSGDERTFPHREALETVVAQDIAFLRESERGEHRLMLIGTGIGVFPSVRSYRGRKKKWDRSKLEQFAAEVEENGLAEASSREGIGLRHGREVMRMAEQAGLVKITKEAGPGGGNLYTLEERDIQEVSPADRADWHRSRWLGARQIGRVLDANWARQSGASGRQG